MKQTTATFAGSATSPSDYPRDGLPEVAFLGRSNVGKSSLLNALAGTGGLARVSSDPGRTRVVNFFRVRGVPRLGGAGHGELYLVDLPGYGYVKAPREVRDSFERIAVSYLAHRGPLRLCVFIVDARHEPSELDLTLREWLDRSALPYVVAANKIDAVNRSQVRQRERSLANGIGNAARAVLALSAKQGTGIGELWRVISGAAFAAPGASGPRAGSAR